MNHALSHTILRPLGAGEACLWYSDKASRINFTTIVHLTGQLERPQLLQALTHLQTRHRLLQTNIAIQNKWPHFYLLADSPIPLSIHLVDSEDWVSFAELEVQTIFDDPLKPLARCVWLQHPQGKSTLIFTFNHAIGDGISGAYVIRDLLRAIAATDSQQDHTASALCEVGPIEHHLPAYAQGFRKWLRYAQNICSLIRWIFKHGRPLPPQMDDPTCDYAIRKVRIIPQVIAPEITAQLAVRAKEERTTIHGALSAAMLLAVAEEWPCAVPMICASPVNLRSHLEPPIRDQIGLFVAFALSKHFIQLPTDHTPDYFWQLAREVRNQLTEFIAQDRAFTLLPPQNQLASRLIRYLSPQAFSRFCQKLMFPATGVTNIGRVDIASQYGSLCIESISFAASLGVLGHFASTASTLNDILRWNFLAMQPDIEYNHARKLAERSYALLEQAL